MREINIPSVLIPVGDRSFEVESPSRANGCIITFTRFTWPSGPLFNLTVFERERGRGLQRLCKLDESGNPTDIVPLIVEARWPADADRDLIRVELEVFQAFTAGVKLEWVA